MLIDLLSACLKGSSRDLTERTREEDRSRRPGKTTSDPSCQPSFSSARDSAQNEEAELQLTCMPWGRGPCSPAHKYRMF